ncbi:MAG TPA: ABC transporter ATP-binding protein [Kofleriaceae bacterium]|jgi:peptide/nickel transport system ATP-binding protein
MLLEVDELVTDFGSVRAVDGVSLALAPRSTLGIVGESGSGKSTLALSIMRLVAGRVSGSITFDGRELLALSPDEMRALRGDRIAMIFQEPMTSLDPVFTIGAQIAEALHVHGKSGDPIELLRLVGMPAPEQRVRAYPHQLSGGMRQRVMIAMAIACKPDLLIADEPTTALDVTVQAQILELLETLQAELGTAILLITHDLGVVAETCDEVIVMYAGRVVEQASTKELLASPRHHYTAGLLRALPTGERGRLREIPGMVPIVRPPGCAFADRCPAVQARCRIDAPELVQLGASRVRCHFPLEAA